MNETLSPDGKHIVMNDYNQNMFNFIIVYNRIGCGLTYDTQAKYDTI